MELKDFLRIAEYGNANWKGSFTTDEIKENASIYYADFQWSKENETISETIKFLAKNLAEDLKGIPETDADYEQVKQWLYQMAEELGLIDMDCNDYLDTDEWLADFI